MRLTDRFFGAVAYTAKIHARQRRKGSGAPYFSHLMRVCGIALEHGADEDEAIAALLHDAAEDQGGPPRLDDIRRRYGPRVAKIVAGCSDTLKSPKPPWRQRKEAYLARLRRALPSVRLVVAADKLDNVRSILIDLRDRGEKIWTWFHGGRDGTLWYYRKVVQALRSNGSNRLVDELARAVAELEQAATAGQKEATGKESG